jgi:predicted outer membrane repeat protein
MLAGISRRTVIALGAAALSMAVGAPGAVAATISPTTTADEAGVGPACSVREAVQAANTNAAFGGCPAGAGADTISLAAGVYTLSIPPDGGPDDNLDGDLDIQTAVTTFARASSGRVTLNGGGVDRVLDLTTGGSNVTINGLVLTGGVTGGSGGAIMARGTLAVIDSTFTGNSVQTHGGAVAARSGGSFTFTNTTFSGNSAEADGGALDSDNVGTSTLLVNSTVTANTADFESNGGGSGGGLNNETGTITIKNTIVTGNTDRGGEAPDCSDTITTQGGNLVGSIATCTFVPLGTDKVGANAALGALGENGGPTPTHALNPGSAALNAAIAGGPIADQRGAPRAAPDIGAYERALCGGVLVNFVGGATKDKFGGTKGADGILGLGGKDKLSGGKGKDGLCGGAGKDQLRGGPGKDKLIGQAGKDTLIGGGAKDICKGGGGKDKQKSC